VKKVAKTYPLTGQSVVFLQAGSCRSAFPSVELRLLTSSFSGVLFGGFGEV
jgi:hypothetical protein